MQLLRVILATGALAACQSSTGDHRFEDGGRAPADSPVLGADAAVLIDSAPANMDADSGSGSGSGSGDGSGSGSGSGSGDGSGSGSGSGGGTSDSIDGQLIACYTQGSPTATCTLPVHCCFTNYSSQHEGTCTSSSCIWGTIECDGPEDCSNGGHCCSTEMIDPVNGITGYTIACQASACGTPPTGEELCHQGGPACANGGSCVGAYGNNNDLPRSLSICR